MFQHDPLHNCGSANSRTPTRWKDKNAIQDVKFNHLQLF